MKTTRFLAVLLTLLAVAAIPSAAAPLVGPCAAGGAYDPACDVDHDGDVDIFDIQLTAGHWRQTGTYNIYPAMVPKTGQTICYNISGTVRFCPGTGQDGDWQKGVTWPNPRFTDNLNGTVTDNLTGLIWLKNANCFGERDWATALSDANTLNSGECGLTDGSVEGDWRLPNVREVQSLLGYEFFGPALPPGHPFINVQLAYYWSSTSYAGHPDNAWIVDLSDCSVRSYPKVGGYMTNIFVLPVRGGQ